jgi:hypothetical protein
MTRRTRSNPQRARLMCHSSETPKFTGGGGFSVSALQKEHLSEPKMKSVSPLTVKEVKSNA